MKQTRRKRDKEAQRVLTNPDEIAHAHRFCVSVAWMQRAYRRSPDYELCDGDGQSNIVGKFYRSKRTGNVKPVQGQCSFQILSNGNPNPNWQGCPYLDGAEKMAVLPPPNRSKILSMVPDDMPVVIINAGAEEVIEVPVDEIPTNEEFEQRDEPGEEDYMARLEALLNQEG